MDGATSPVMRTDGRAGDDGGYTLLELVTVVAVVAVAAALAYPSLAGMRRGQELESAAVGVAQGLRLAHWRAVAAGQRVRVMPRAGAGRGVALRTEREKGAAWVAEGEERVPRGAVVAVAGPAEKVFNPDGTCSMGSITLRGAAASLPVHARPGDRQGAALPRRPGGGRGR